MGPLRKKERRLTFASPNTMYMSDAGLLNTSGLLMTNRILLDFLMVILVTPWTGFKPSLDMAYIHIQSM